MYLISNLLRASLAADDMFGVSITIWIGVRMMDCVNEMAQSYQWASCIDQT
jgi:hypothetical protein